MNEYKIYIKHDCGWYTSVPFGSMFHIHDVLCPTCGGNIPSKNDCVERDPSWELIPARRVTRRVGKIIWWNPLTWFDTEVILERRSEDRPSSEA